MDQYEDQTFVKEDFSGKLWRGATFQRCIFQGCDLSEVNLEGAGIIECRFEKCNLSLLKMEGCRCQNIIFAHSKILGVNFSLCQSKIFLVNFEECQLRMCDFSFLPMDKTSFGESQIIQSQFLESKLKGANFSGCDLQETSFRNCQLQKSDFRDARNYQLDPSNNQVKGAKFSFPEALGLLDCFEITVA